MLTQQAHPADRPNIFEYRSARKYLLDSVEHLKKTESSFSIRSWARQMGLNNHALLLFVIQGKRALTLKQVPYLSVGLRLNSDERLYFQTLIHLEQARTDEEKQLVTRWFQEFDPVGSYRVKEIDEYRSISHWIHMAILARVHSRQGVKDPTELFSIFKHRLSTVEIRAAFERLLSMGLISYDTQKERFQVTHERVTTRNDVVNLGVRQYHQQVAQMAGEAVHHQSPEEREFQSFAMSVPSDRLPELKEMIRRFRTQIESKLREWSNSPSMNELSTEQVYQMNLHLFRLSELPQCPLVTEEQVPAGARPTLSAELAAEKSKMEFD